MKAVGKEAGPWQIWVDTGGTFTDCVAVDPAGDRSHVKVLSSSALRGTIQQVLSKNILQIDQQWDAPNHFVDSFQFSVLNKSHKNLIVKRFDAKQSRIILSHAIADESWTGQSFEVRSSEEPPILAARLITQTPPGKSLPPIKMRLATTRGTNALLERKGAPVALFITEGFGDFLKIGTQQRPDLFALKINKPASLFNKVVEARERIDAKGEVLRDLDVKALKRNAKKLLNDDIESAAVVLMNSYVNPVHEQKIRKILKKLGFKYISVSSTLSPFIQFLPRAETTLINAYLAAVMQDYLDDVMAVVGQDNLFVMTSAGGLKKSATFAAKDGLLSGPAAGIVGAAAAGEKAGCKKIISFDMGGTSTDVARYDGDFEYVFEYSIGDAHLMTPAMSIETVAAGGGSICWFDGDSLHVGSESAGAFPGPACYGAGGPLTLTDVNLLAGRIDVTNFQIPLSAMDAEKKMQQIVDAVEKKEGRKIKKEAILEGFLDIANQRMAGAIEKISLRKGYDAKTYALVSFGGAGGQHCCAIAKKLGISRVIVPSNGGILSAAGLGHAVLEHFEEKQILEELQEISSGISGLMDNLTNRAMGVLAQENASESLMVRQKLLFMRIKGQKSTLKIDFNPKKDIAETFRKKYKKRYGLWIDDAVIEVESLRVVVSTETTHASQLNISEKSYEDWPVFSKKEILFDGRKILSPIYKYQEASPGISAEGPALIITMYSSILVEPGWKVDVLQNGLLILNHTKKSVPERSKAHTEVAELELYTHRFTSITEKMGEMLRRTALSVNVKDRNDFSCALLNPEGELVVNAPHIPVHLGALGISVRSLKKHIEMGRGDVVVTNHPAFGGSHLPDVTLITPVFTADNQLIGYTASRAHHAEIGGIRPGSMPPNATNLMQEGVVIPPLYLIRKGQNCIHKIREHLLDAMYPTRSIEENMADLQAQLAANQQGAHALQNLAEVSGVDKLHYYIKQLKDRAARLMRQTIQHIPNGTYKSRELLDDNTPLCVKWEIFDETVSINFEGTGPVHPLNLNATPAIVNSVVMYVLRVLINEPIPLNEGLLAPVTIILPECLLNPAFSDDPANSPAVVGGNVEISQRLTDTLLKPFERIACGQGTMNNVLFGNEAFGYYETVGGGSGAGPDFNGTDAVHQHMTNTSGTDPEILEKHYPVRLDSYKIRKKSGGSGKYLGGDGITRELTFLQPVQLSVLTQHRVQAPYGLQGGTPGKKGKQWIIRKNGEKKVLNPTDGCDLEAGDRFILHTPGGGGFGKAE